MNGNGWNNLSSLRAGGFTLTELLVVVLILAIGIALIVGVATTVQETARSEETKNIQRVALAGLKAYYESGEKAYPPGNGGADSSEALLMRLQNVAQGRKELRRLPKHAIAEDSSGRRRLVDGFGNPMLYYQSGGMDGKTPRLISQGPDALDPTDDIAMDMN